MATFSFAQDRFGEINGTISDSTGAVIPGATVTIQGNAFSRTVTANDEGYYRVLAVPPGSYKITAKAILNSLLVKNFSKAISKKGTSGKL